MKTITREQMKVLESTAVSKYKIPSLLLMENAGQRVADVALKTLEEMGKDIQSSKVVVLCGVGNNGGDGAVVARHLHNFGAEVEVVLTRDLNKIFVSDYDATALDGNSAMGGMTEDSSLNMRILRSMNINVSVPGENDFFHRYFSGCDLIVDALLGTGLNTDLGKIKSPTKELIMVVNELEIPVIAVDIPSGLDSNSGDLVGLAIQADKTVTFGLAKKGFYSSVGPSVCGEVIVVDISIPRVLFENLKDV